MFNDKLIQLLQENPRIPIFIFGEEDMLYVDNGSLGVAKPTWCELSGYYETTNTKHFKIECVEEEIEMIEDFLRDNKLLSPVGDKEYTNEELIDIYINVVDWKPCIAIHLDYV